jgi:hypothetical protein
MGDIMRPVPFEALLTRIFDEYQNHRSIFGIPEQQFYSPQTQIDSPCSARVAQPRLARPPDRIPSWRKILSPPG